jgi:CRP/FNR family cyclic AMP-dependent transcriptional regulator
MGQAWHLLTHHLQQTIGSASVRTEASRDHLRKDMDMSLNVMVRRESSRLRSDRAYSPMRRDIPIARPPSAPLNAEPFLATVGSRKTILTYPKRHIIFSQGDTADAVFYIQEGRVKLTVVSQQGKEAVVAILEPGDFLGEACLAGRPVCLATATSVDDSTIIRIDKRAMARVLHDEPPFSVLFMSYLLSRNIRVQEDLVDQLFNSSEKRLARVLLLLARFGEQGEPEPVIPRISQETLADMVGTTRSRVSFFMNKFRNLHYIDYDSVDLKRGIHVRSSLLNVVLHD